MWVIVERYREKPNCSWISGVFKRLDDAQKYLAESFHEEFHKQHNPTPPLQTIREIPAQDYPVLFIYDFTEFDYRYVTVDELADAIAALKRVDDEDHQYFIYDIFREDYRAIKAGEFYVEMIDHHHVDNGEISSLLIGGLGTRIVGRDGIYACENCHKRSPGVLCEKGYGPPQGWLIIPEADVYEAEDLDPGESYLTLCSEDCRQLLGRSFEGLDLD